MASETRDPYIIALIQQPLSALLNSLCVTNPPPLCLFFLQKAQRRGPSLHIKIKVSQTMQSNTLFSPAPAIIFDIQAENALHLVNAD